MHQNCCDNAIERKRERIKDLVYNMFIVHICTQKHTYTHNRTYICATRIDTSCDVCSHEWNVNEKKKCHKCIALHLPDHIISGVGFVWFQFSFLNNWYIWAGFWTAATTKHRIRWNNNRFGEIGCREFLSKHFFSWCIARHRRDVAICREKSNRKHCFNWMHLMEEKFEWKEFWLSLPFVFALGKSYSLGAESLLWFRDGFECFGSRCSFDELFVDDELPLLVHLLLLLLLELSFVLLLLLLLLLPASPPETFNKSVLRLLDELLVFIWLVLWLIGCNWTIICFAANGAVCCTADDEDDDDNDDIDELPGSPLTFDFLCADFCDPFCDDGFGSKVDGCRVGGWSINREMGKNK